MNVRARNTVAGTEFYTLSPEKQIGPYTYDEMNKLDFTEKAAADLNASLQEVTIAILNPDPGDIGFPRKPKPEPKHYPQKPTIKNRCHRCLLGDHEPLCYPCGLKWSVRIKNQWNERYFTYICKNCGWEWDKHPSFLKQHEKWCTQSEARRIDLETILEDNTHQMIVKANKRYVEELIIKYRGVKLG